MSILALTVFGWDLASEPHFMDESAYLSQSFFADLWVEGRWDDPTWLTYAGYDLPPLPKYVIGTALKLEGFRRPGPSAMVAWYLNPGTPPVARAVLVAARRPSVVFGMIGCLAIFAIGTIALDRRLGFVAAILLILNPLYAMHARRAMSDVPAEAFILATLAVGLWAWKRLLSGARPVGPVLALVFGSGLLAGLATLSKLNGALGGLILGAWVVLALPLPGVLFRSKVALVLATTGAGCVAFATFAALNPFLFAHPKGPIDPRLEPIARLGFVERARVIKDHRVGVSDSARASFPHNALNTPLEKVEAVAVQGFGRFGPFGPRGGTDSTIRFDPAQDRGAWLWLPWVALGLVAALRLGRDQIRRGEPPTGWALASQAGVALVVVTSFIPLAWDRYFLSIQPGFALLGALAAVGAFDLVRARLGRGPRSESPL